MHNLEELQDYGIQSFEQGTSIQEFSQLTKQRTLKIKFNFVVLDDSEARSQTEAIQSYVVNLISSCNLHNLIYTKGANSLEYPLALHSWHPAASCSIRKLCIKNFIIYRVPNWMGSLGNLGVLELIIICVRPEDAEILGEMPSLLFLSLTTVGGTSGRIVFPGNSRFRSLKYFSLFIGFCGISLEFEAGSMSKLEHLKLQFNAHEMECLNGASSFSIQHLSSLNKVEIIIRSQNDDDDIVRYISRAINAAIETLSNRPTVMFEVVDESYYCKHFELILREWNQDMEGLLAEWLKLWQIREERAEEATDSKMEQEDDSHENEDEEWADKDKETSEKEVAQQDDGGSSN